MVYTCLVLLSCSIFPGGSRAPIAVGFFDCAKIALIMGRCISQNMRRGFLLTLAGSE